MAISKLKLANGRTRYRVRYREPGIRNPKTATFDSKAEAQEFEANLRIAKNGGRMVRKASNQTLEAFGIEYRERYALVELAPSTLKVQRSMWNVHILPKLGGQPLATLAANPELVQGFKADLLNEGVGEAAVRKALAVLSAVLSKGVEWGRIQSNPCATVRLPSGKRKHRVRPMPPEVVERLRALMPSERDRRLISVLAYAGLRPGEALALEGSDVTLKVVLIDKAVSLGEIGDTKTKVDRTVPLLAALREDLSPRDTGLLFGRSDGEPWKDHDYRNWRKRVFKPAVAKLGDEWASFRPYDLRHSFASLLLHEGRSLPSVARALGHSVAVLSNVYAHVLDELEGEPQVPADTAIANARTKLAGERVKNVSRTEAA